jgi:hypothetical protein
VRHASETPKHLHQALLAVREIYNATRSNATTSSRLQRFARNSFNPRPCHA